MIKNYPTWSIYVLLVCGFVTLLFGSWIVYRAVKVSNFGLQTEGTIVEYISRVKNPQSITSKGMVYTPTFSFITKDGIKYTLRSSVYEEDKPYEIGDTVIVRYDHMNPKNAYIANRFPWKIGLSLIAFGLFCLIFCAIELKKRF